eukprot:TRINITY_DN527_c0_g1_i2.p2 TRINITY_DN527_c0_g1~~TRINITY_DN527_c0_g1_i2.p2  ORF type:complete len:154 (-),score=31.10 TRINITY_DN527_c0_g1_i2:559-1020(-)
MYKETKRVKVYKMEGEQWVDHGVGFVSIETIYDTPYIKVKSEIDDNVLLKVKIYNQEGVYNRQAESLIVWSQTEEDGSTRGDPVHLALSFQDKNGCNTTWGDIMEAQQKMKDVAANTFLDSVFENDQSNTKHNSQNHKKKTATQQQKLECFVV